MLGTNPGGCPSSDGKTRGSVRYDGDGSGSGRLGVEGASVGTSVG